MCIRDSGSIDVNQVSGFFAPTAGRKWVDCSTSTTLVVNTRYYITSFAGTSIELTLPASPASGDEIRVLDTTDALTYNKSIIIKTDGTKPIQGDSQGQLVVQTPGAGLGLVFLGNTIGWRLIEL